MRKKTYVIGVGEEDEQRLSLLNEVFGETSRNLLLKAGLKQDMRVLEIGCGTGNMTKFIASQVGHNGTVCAVDQSHEQITLAKKNCAAEKNIHFIESSVFDLKDLEKFDVIYSRFLLMHLEEPFNAFQLLTQFLKPGGVIVCEEATNNVIACYPDSAVFQKNRTLILALFKNLNVACDIGDKLYPYYRQLNMKDIFVNFIQPVYTQQQKVMIKLLFNQLKNKYIEMGLATETEINQLALELDPFIADDQYLVSFVRTTQIFGRLS